MSRTPPTPEIRPAGPEHADQIFSAAETTFELHRAHRPGQEKTFEGSDLQAFLCQGLNRYGQHRVFAAFLNARLIGYMLISAPKPGSALAFVNDIWVHERHRGKGIAPSLLAEAIRNQEDAGWGYLAATIADWNTASLGAFRRAGFLEWKNHGLKDDGHGFHILVRPRRGKVLPRPLLRWFWLLGAVPVLIAFALSVLTL
ncbi:N-acetyltransferase family protein [Primorskyibacter sp. 2E107]|uniref:GNAT family N-acetyltransferase n=1 Tax=Primorskyibacter sp. 2E107 TaxID=3403458 RepID=UPI003AF7B691